MMGKSYKFHKSSWYLKGVKCCYDRHGCSNGVCVPECKCKYYLQTVLIINKEVLGLVWEENKVYARVTDFNKNQ
jgi:hypothetical protein